MNREQFISRYYCVIEHFNPPDIGILKIPVMIIESDNDTLVEEVLRRKLKETYPTAEVSTLKGAGHFPYLNRPDEYSEILRGFLP